MTDASGYFYIPGLPARTPFEAVAIDTLTGNSRTFEGTGVDFGESNFLFFDFLSSDTPPPTPGTVRWDGGGDGTTWFDPLNWDGDAVPGAGDDVIIDVPGEITVVYSSGDTIIKSLDSKEALTLEFGSEPTVLTVAGDVVIDNDLTLNTATLDASNVTVNGILTAMAGTISGTGTLLLPAGSSLEIENFAQVLLIAMNLDNEGTIVHKSGVLTFASGVAMTNQPGGVIRFEDSTENHRVHGFERRLAGQRRLDPQGQRRLQRDRAVRIHFRGRHLRHAGGSAPPGRPDGYLRR